MKHKIRNVLGISCIVIALVFALFGCNTSSSIAKIDKFYDKLITSDSVTIIVQTSGLNSLIHMEKIDGDKTYYNDGEDYEEYEKYEDGITYLYTKNSMGIWSKNIESSSAEFEVDNNFLLEEYIYDNFIDSFNSKKYEYDKQTDKYLLKKGITSYLLIYNFSNLTLQIFDNGCVFIGDLENDDCPLLTVTIRNLNDTEIILPEV